MQIPADQLIRQLKAKDKKAIDALYDAYAPALYGIILKIIDKEGPAKDALQETFVKIWNKGPTYDSSKGSLFTWMLNIARNSAIDKLRQNEREQRVLWEQLGIENGPSNGYHEPNEDYIGLSDLVHKLEYKYQQVIDLIYFKGYTHEEVMEELDIPLGTVKSRTRIALRELRKFFVYQQASFIGLLALTAMYYHG
jgi:RNA polymerase sigma factor (sigma-70 family)